MDLFGPLPGGNLLPCDGVVSYHGPVLSPEDGRRYFEALWREVPWRHDELVIFGKRQVTARKVAWYGDAGLDYSYSGSTKTPLPWSGSGPLPELKRLVEERCGTAFNSCLLNLYHSGAEGMGWHSDDEKSLEAHAPIACLSLGAERKFRFRHKHLKRTADVLLKPESLLLMAGETQTHWQHCLPKMLRVSGPRISLTFRRMAAT